MMRKLTAIMVAAAVLGIPVLSPAEAPPTALVPKPGSGAIQVRLMFAAGSAYDPAGKEGLAQFVASGLRRGSRQFDRATIDTRLDALAARLGIEVDREVVIIDGMVLTEAWQDFYPLWLSIVTEPAFDSAEMTRLVGDQLDAVEQIRRDDAALARAALQHFLFENHPYGHPEKGYERTVRTLTAADARSFYDMYYTGGNYILGLAGDVSQALADSINAALAAALKPGTPPPLNLPPVTTTGFNLCLIEKENRAQTQLRFGRVIDIDRADPDFMALFLANTHLGRHRESLGRLYQTIRAQRGLSYGAYSYAEHFDQDGGSNLARPGRPRTRQYFSAWVYPKSANANFVIHAVAKEMSDLARNGLTPEQLRAAREFEINHFPFEIETPARLLGMRMDELYLKTPRFVDEFTTAAARVTVDDVRRATGRAMDINNLVVVAVVSDGAAFARQLREGPVVCEYPSGVDAKTMAEADAPYQSFEIPFDPQRVRIIKADEMFR